MSGTLITSVITNIGNTEIINNGTTAAGISIAYAQIGSANISTLTTAQLQALTAVSGLVYSSTSNSSVLSYTASPSNNTVAFKVTLDESIGPFPIGNIGLFDNNNNLIAISALTNTATKIATTVNGPGNRKTYNINITFSNAATITNFTLLSQNASSIPTVANQTLLPAPTSAPYNLYLVQQHTDYNEVCLAALYNGAWYYILLDGSSYPEGEGSINVPGMFASGVNPGDAVYYNPTSKNFVLANSVNNFEQAPIGLKGYGDYLYPNNSVFVSQNATQYTTGSLYYCSAAGTSPNVSATASSVPIGVAIAPNKLYVSISNYNFSSIGNFALQSTPGTTAIGMINGFIDVNAPFNINSGLTINSTSGEPLYLVNPTNTTVSTNIYNDGTYYRTQFVDNGVQTNENFANIQTGALEFDALAKGTTFAGAVTMLSSLALTYAATVGSLTANTNAQVNGNLDVLGSTTLNTATINSGVVTGNQIVQGNLNVSGASTLSLTSFLSNITVAGIASLASAVINNTLSVTYAATVGSLTANTNALVKSNLDVLGSATISSSLDVTGAASLGATTINGNQTVTGSAQILGVLSAANGTSGFDVVNYGQFLVYGAGVSGFSLPNGITVFYGEAATNSSGDANVNFPVAFTNGPFAVFTQSTGSTNGDHAQPLNVTSTGFGIYTVDGSGTTNGPQSVYWIAIGIIT